ncbi:MAG: serine protease [Gammaproteobacteria bacterium]|nr:serine protease [Gammaproteobacteria bacterium]
MFVKALEGAAGFTRAIHSISRNYGSTTIQPGAATMFFVNSDGWALTCNHVAKQLIVAEQLASARRAFEEELAAIRGHKREKQLLRELERKYGYAKDVTFELYNSFINCIEGPLNAEIKLHDKLDVALIHFTDFTKLLCSSFPTFATNGSELKQGKFLCRLGFPFVEFTNFAYYEASDSIHWTTTGRRDTPAFPIEGMVTRHIADDTARVVAFELSTPGLRGQSGAPAFDSEGMIWGMQYATNHLDLDFDINQDVMRDGIKRKVRDSVFLHVGYCIHVDALKSFMTQHGVRFQKG